jgi:hypothetical protein
MDYFKMKMVNMIEKKTRSNCSAQSLLFPIRQQQTPNLVYKMVPQLSGKKMTFSVFFF